MVLKELDRESDRMATFLVFVREYNVFISFSKYIILVHTG